MFTDKKRQFSGEEKKKKNPPPSSHTNMDVGLHRESVCSTIYLLDLKFPSRLLQFGKGVPNFLHVMSGSGHIIIH